MHCKVLVLNKKIFQDRHIISDVLLETGEKKTVLFYGGRGGGAKQKPSNIQLGNALLVTLSSSKSQMFNCKEWKGHWQHKSIEKDYKAFFLLNFFCELITHVSIEDNLNQGKEVGELYNLLSNASFYLEKASESKNLKIASFCSLFLGKLIYYLGIFPDLVSCATCEKDLKLAGRFKLLEGRFDCLDCSSTTQQAFEQEFFLKVLKTSYKEYKEFIEVDISMTKQIYTYLLQQFQLNQDHIKSSQFIFGG